MGQPISQVPTDALRALGQHIDTQHQTVLDEQGQAWLAQAREGALASVHGPTSLHELGHVVAESNDNVLTLSNTLQEVRGRLLQPRPEPDRRWAWAMGGGGALAAVALAFFLLGSPSAPGPLTVLAQPTVAAVAVDGMAAEQLAGGRAVALGQWQEAGDETLRFSDGSTVAQVAGSRFRVTTLRPEGADIELAAGQVAVSVVPRDGNRWRIHAGPFVVHVLGTEFDVSWDAETGGFSLALRRGKVRIEGPVVGEQVLTAGRQIKVNTLGRKVVLESLTTTVAGKLASPTSSAAAGTPRQVARVADPEPAPGAAAGREPTQGRPTAAVAEVAPEEAKERRDESGAIDAPAAPAGTNLEVDPLAADEPEPTQERQGRQAAPGTLAKPVRGQETTSKATPVKPATAKAATAKRPDSRDSRVAGTAKRRATGKLSQPSAAKKLGDAVSGKSTGAHTAGRTAQGHQAGTAKPAAAGTAAAGTTGRPAQPTIAGGTASDTAAGSAALAGRDSVKPAVVPTTPWDLASQGKWREAVRAAEVLGWSNVAARATAQQLLSVADAARLSHASATAARTYALVRSTHPGTASAAQAAFSLGRLKVRQGQLNDAARWFERYVQERPKGSLAEQARGRALACRAKLPDDQAACSAAKGYLQRHPKGPRASLALKEQRRCVAATP